METPGEVRQRDDNQWPNSCFGYYFGRNSFKIKLERWSFSDRFGILLEKRLSGVAELTYIMVYGKSQFNVDLKGNPKGGKPTGSGFCFRCQPLLQKPDPFGSLLGHRI